MKMDPDISLFLFLVNIIYFLFVCFCFVFTSFFLNKIKFRMFYLDLGLNFFSLSREIVIGLEPVF